MSVQPAQPLNEHVRRTGVRDQEIRVDVERLLAGLGRDDDTPAACTFLPDGCDYTRIQNTTIVIGPPTVMKHNWEVSLIEELIVLDGVG